MDNEIMKVSNAVVEKVQKGEYDTIGLEISEETASELIVGLCQVATQVSAIAFDKVAKIYTDAMMRQENLEQAFIKNDTEIINRFNGQVEEAMKQLDLNDSKNVESFDKVCSTLRDNIRVELGNRHKPTILEKIFRR